MRSMNQYAQYNNSKVLTASPAELTLMLYDGAIKFNNIAIMAIEKKDIEKAHNNIVKVEKIINEFRATLDSKYEVSKDFDRVCVSSAEVTGGKCKEGSGNSGRGEYTSQEYAGYLETGNGSEQNNKTVIRQFSERWSCKRHDHFSK